MNRRTIAILALLAPIAIWAQGVKIEFFTPSVVHVVKYQGQAVNPESKVIIAKPQDVALTQKGNTTSSKELSVKLDQTHSAGISPSDFSELKSVFPPSAFGCGILFSPCHYMSCHS